MGSCCTKVKAIAVAAHSVNENSSMVRKPVTLSETQRGEHVQVSTLVIYGRGTALANEAIQGDRAYFEILVRTPGKLAVGVAQLSREPQKSLGELVGDNKNSWGLKSDMLAAVPLAGDVIGVLFDRFGSAGKSPKLSFTLNGLPLGDLYDVPRSMSPEELKIDANSSPLYPAASVAKKASVEFLFARESLRYAPPAGFEPVATYSTAIVYS